MASQRKVDTDRPALLQAVCVEVAIVSAIVVVGPREATASRGRRAGRPAARPGDRENPLSVLKIS
jgi:hypothetical protein